MSILIGVLDIQGSTEEHAAMLEQIGVKARLVKTPRDLDEVAGLIMPGGESTTIGKLLKSTGLDTAICERASFGRSVGHKGRKGRDRAALSKRDRKIAPLAVWGTCAGAILLAKLGLMHIKVERNYYGSQQESFEADILIDFALPQGRAAPAYRLPASQAGTGRHGATAKPSEESGFLPAGRQGASSERRLSLSNNGLGKGLFHAIFIRAPLMRKAAKSVDALAHFDGADVMLREENLLATSFHPELTDDPQIHEYFIRLTRIYAEKK